jgi:flagellar secretion chaperone FliS
MSHIGHDAYLDAYLEGRILSADPLELIRLLYQGAADAVRQARRSLAEGDIAGRSQAISRAYEIVAELAGSLDLTQGGEFGDRLLRLYDYLQRRLIEANLQQTDGPLAEVLGLLSTLAEGWQGAQGQAEPARPAASAAWGAPPPAELEPATHAWSF